MVRTYRQDRYQLVSPWEKAMRTADSDEGRPVNTGKRVYADMKVTQTSYNHNAQKNLKLPPITEDPQKTIGFLAEEVGKSLARSKGKIKTIEKEFVLYDPSNTGLMSKTSGYEILQRYRIPTNENYQKKVLAFFVDQEQPGKINHSKLIEFLQNSRRAYLEKIELNSQRSQAETEVADPVISDNTHGRYDSSSTMNEVQNKPRKAHQQAFMERRDVGLLLEIERVLKSYKNKDPHDMLDELEDALKRTCRSDDFLSDNGHVRSLVSKHEIPLNTALTLKCIERLDPHDTGKIEWPRFMEFLRKALGGSPRRTQNKVRSPSEDSLATNETVPLKPAWETRVPLSRISNHTDDYNHGKESTPNEYASNNKWEDNNDHFGYTKTPSAPIITTDPYSSYDDTNGYENFDNNNQNEEVFPQMDDGIEEAFARNIEEIRRNYQEDEPVQQENPFQAMGERGQLYKRVSNALEDKAKPTNGMLLTNDVRKIMNYYNLLFDADFPMDQINSMLQRYSQNDQIHCDQVVGMFGKQII